MNWVVLIPIIAQEGLPVAEAIFKRWSSGTPPTEADFDAWRALGQQTAKDRMRAKLVQAGIPLDSTQAVSLLALT